MVGDVHETRVPQTRPLAVGDRVRIRTGIAAGHEAIIVHRFELLDRLLVSFHRDGEWWQFMYSAGELERISVSMPSSESEAPSSSERRKPGR